MQSRNTNGPEDANNSSSQYKSHIQSPANDSYRSSLYIAALSTYLGIEGLASPVKDHVNGIDYAFSFYQPYDSTLIKVFNVFNACEYAKYVSHPGKHIIIIDVADMACQAKLCADCGIPYLELPPLMQEQVSTDGWTFIYCDHTLWDFSPADDGHGMWEPMVPIEIILVEDDAEDESD